MSDDLTGFWRNKHIDPRESEDDYGGLSSYFYIEADIMQSNEEYVLHVAYREGGKWRLFVLRVDLTRLIDNCARVWR